MGKQSPVMVEITSKPDIEGTALRGDGGPDIVARQRLGDAPKCVEDAKRAVGLHETDEMHAPRRDRQGGRQGAPQGGGKPGPMLGALPLRWGRTIQRGRTIVVHVPLDEARTLTTDVPKASKVMALPKGRATPQAVQLFDLPVVLGFGEGQEDQFDPDIQTQPGELPHHALDFVATTEDGVVVELQKARHAADLPGVQDSNCSRVGQALETAKNGLFRRGIRQRLDTLKAKNILLVTYLIVNFRFFQGFPHFSRKTLSVRGVNSYSKTCAWAVRNSLLRARVWCRARVRRLQRFSIE